MPTIDELQIEITQSTNSATGGIDSLIKTLEKLKGSVRGGVGLTTVANQLRRLNEALSELEDPTENIERLVRSLRPLETIQKTNLNSTINSLRKIPNITRQLSETNLDIFAKQIERVVVSIRPLADEMNKVAQGFSAFPSRIQRLISQNEKLTASNRKTASSFGVMGTGVSQLKFKIGLLVVALDRVASRVSEWIVSSNNYVENLNLFRISMRDASDEALKFAERVYDAFGVDPSEWIRFQAVFQNMATGFGIAGDKASVMSKNLTQLGYDLATVFNVDYEVSMQKLQSALAGQPRPMREWGFDMSEATLKLTALRHGIEENVETMTQYEKSQIRYLQVMETASRQGVLGNFAREIHTPANAMRILNQQLELFKRELGNIIIPLLMKVLPYLQAFVRVLSDMAQALAMLTGFTLPVIDYSGIGSLPPLLDDVENGFDDAGKSAKKFKNSLMGFDELNILQRDLGGVTSNLEMMGSGFLDIDPHLYDYDFLGGVTNEVNKIVDKIYAKTKPLVKFIKENLTHVLDLAKAIGVTFLAWKVAGGIGAIFDTISKFPGNIGSKVFGLSLILGGITFSSLSLANLVGGTGDFIDVVKAALGSAAVFGLSLLFFGTGPLGWTIGIASVLAITIAGITIGSNRKVKAMVDEAMSGGGVSLDELSVAFTKEMEIIGGRYDILIEGGEKLKQYNRNIEQSHQTIETLFTMIKSNAGDSADTFRELITVISEFINETRLLRDQAYENIIHGLSNSITDVMDTIGKSKNTIIRDLLLIKNEGDERLTDAELRIREYTKAWEEGTLSIDDAANKIIEAYQEVNNGRTIVDDIGDSFLGMATKLDRIKWDGSDNVASFLSDISDAARKARENVDAAKDAFIESSKVYLSDIVDPMERKRAAEKLYAWADSEQEAAYGKIRDNLDLLYSTLEKDMLRRIDQVSTNVQQEWEKKGFWEKLFRGGIMPFGETADTEAAIRDIKKNYVDVISDSFDKMMKDLGSEGSISMQEAMKRITKEGLAFDFKSYASSFQSKPHDSFRLRDVISEEIDRASIALGENAYKLGQQIPQGVRRGIDDSSGIMDNSLVNIVANMNGVLQTELDKSRPSLVDMFSEMGENMGDGLELGLEGTIEEKKYTSIFSKIGGFFRSLFGIQSPSKVFMEYGNDLGEGLIIGVSDNIRANLDRWDTVWGSIWENIKTVAENNLTAVNDTVKNKISDIMDSIKNADIKSTWDTLWGGLSLPKIKLPHFSMDGEFSVMPPKTPKVNVDWYASGGFPKSGELFAAREPGNPELVGSIGGRTAVANNDQIVTAVSAGVAKAVREVLVSSSGTGGDIVIEVNQRELGRATMASWKLWQKQNGKTVLDW